MLPGILSPIAAAGNSFYSVTQTDARTSLATSFSNVSFGDADPTRMIVVLAWGERTTNNPGVPGCDINGVAATRIIYESTGNGLGDAAEVGMFVGQPSGTSGTVAISWFSGLRSEIVVLRVTGFSTSSTATVSEGGSSGDGFLPFNVPAGGFILAAGASGNSTNPMNMGNITTRGDETTNIRRKSWGWDFLQPAASPLTISINNWVVGQGQCAGIAASFAPLS